MLVGPRARAFLTDAENLGCRCGQKLRKAQEELRKQEAGATKCDRCGKLGTVEAHACPYKEEINGNSETLCRCCDECRHECLMDI